MKRKKVSVGDISVSYLTREVDNAKATVVFIHGFPFNKNMWIPQLDDLPDGVQGVAIDVRGHGNSTSGHGFFSIDVFARDLLKFIKTLKLGKVVVCGVSMGGYIALRANELAPDALAGLILTDTHSYGDSNEAKTKRFATLDSVLKHGKRTFSVGFVSTVLASKTLTQKPEVVEFIKSSIRRNTEVSICATILALASRTDTTEGLSNVRVPVLLIRGSEDKLVSAEQMRKMEELIPDVKYVEFSNCGHLPNLENPPRFNGELKNFLISKIL